MRYVASSITFHFWELYRYSAINAFLSCVFSKKSLPRTFQVPFSWISRQAFCCILARGVGMAQEAQAQRCRLVPIPRCASCKCMAFLFSTYIKLKAMMASFLFTVGYSSAHPDEASLSSIFNSVNLPPLEDLLIHLSVI